MDSDIKNLSSTSLNVIGAVSRYDVEYMRYYTGLIPTLISSYSGFYTNNREDNNGHRSEILIFRQKGYIYGVQAAEEFVKEVKESLAPEYTAESVYKLYPFYTTKELTKHPAIIFLPYSVMSYRFTELYALSIPIFVPSSKFFLEYYDPGTHMFGLGWDRTSTKPPMCDKDPSLEEKMRPSTYR